MKSSAKEERDQASSRQWRRPAQNDQTSVCWLILALQRQLLAWTVYRTESHQRPMIVDALRYQQSGPAGRCSTCLPCTSLLTDSSSRTLLVHVLNVWNMVEWDLLVLHVMTEARLAAKLRLIMEWRDKFVGGSCVFAMKLNPDLQVLGQSVY